MFDPISFLVLVAVLFWDDEFCSRTKSTDEYYVGTVESVGELSEIDSTFPTDAFRSIRVRVDAGSKVMGG